MKVPILAALLLLTGCSTSQVDPVDQPTSAPHDAIASTSVLSGRLVGAGGPYPAPDTAYRGEVRAVRTDGSTWTARTDREGRFRLSLPTGDYAVTGRSPSYDVGASWPCRATNPVAVLPPEPTHENVWCVRR